MSLNCAPFELTTKVLRVSLMQLAPRELPGTAVGVMVNSYKVENLGWSQVALLAMVSCGMNGNLKIVQLHWITLLSMRG